MSIQTKNLITENLQKKRKKKKKENKTRNIFKLKTESSILTVELLIKSWKMWVNHYTLFYL